ncbi:hypothetical protein FOXYSP1_08304 [Fusarium oxysporum f. sp. phaseoli]
MTPFLLKANSAHGRSLLQQSMLGQRPQAMHSQSRTLGRPLVEELKLSTYVTVAQSPLVPHRNGCKRLQYVIQDAPYLS